ncbi:MAG: diadenylate cyclase [Phycisphaerales bacterium]
MLGEFLVIFRSSPWLVLTELVVIWIAVWLAYRFLRGTRGGGAIKGFVLILMVATFLIRVIGQGNDAFERLAFLYNRFLGLAAILLIVVFQPELRQAMIRLGHAWTFGVRRDGARTTAAMVAEASEFLSRAKFGAIMAIERRTRLGGLAESGVELDAVLSVRLLQSIFYPNSPLHDLGVVIRDTRIAAASVQFPLVEEGVLPPEFGSRHRAAVGLSTECDCLVVVVSEETGRIVICERGHIDGPYDREALSEELTRRLAGSDADRNSDDASADDSDTTIIRVDAPSGSSSASSSATSSASSSGSTPAATATATPRAASASPAVPDPDDASRPSSISSSVSPSPN